MALRQVLFSRGFVNIRKQHFNFDFVKRQRLSTTPPVRFIRNKPQQDAKQALRESHTNSPFEGFVPSGEHIRPDAMIKATMFTVAFTAGSFISVTIWEYEKIRSKAINVMRNANPMGWIKKKTQKQQEIVSELQAELNRINKEIDTLWGKLSPGERVFVPILLLNCLVFAAWRVPRLKPFMLQNFASNPAAKALCWPMVLSTFSHYSLFHLFANMYVLHSFSAACTSLGKEQFLGLYLSAGVISSLTSYLFKFASKAPGYSLGASGAIMAILAYVCNHYPDTKLGILFIPQFQFSAGTAIQAIMAFDLAGIIFRWKLFDHAAHLGGACVGLFWSQYGQNHLWPLREHFVGVYHQIRGKPQK